MALVVPIIADTSGLTRGLTQGTSGLRKFGKMAAIVGGAAALGGLVATLKIGVDEFMTAQKVMAQTGAVLKSTGGAANVTSKQITDMSTSLMKLSGIDDEAIQSGQNLLLTFTKIRNETGKGNNIFDQATLAMTNLSVAMGKDLSSSAILVGKALNDPVKGVGALSRAGVQFTASQKDTIKALVESGDVMGAQKMILKELETQFGGSAKAAGQTLPGQLNILKETFRNLAADLIAGFIPAVSRGTQAFLGFVRDIAKQPTLSAKIQFIVGTFAGAAWRGVQSLIEWWTTPKTQFENSPTSGLHIKLIPAGSDQVAAFFASLNAAMKKKANAFGNSIGYGIMDAIFGGAKSQAGKNAKNTLGLFVTLINPVALNQWAGGVGREMISGLWDGFKQWLADNPGVAGQAIKNWLTSAADSMGGVIGQVWREATGQSKRSAPIFIGVVTKTVRDAVNAARQGLAGLGSSLGGMLSTITGLSSADAKRAAEIRKQQKSEAATREGNRLQLVKDSATTDEELAQANQDLQDFKLEQEAIAAEDRVALAQSTNQRAIDDLIESFNQGTISAQTFAADLNAIIGANRGAELGAAFAGAFGRELQSIIAAANDIQSVINRGGQNLPITGETGTPAGDAARAAHAEWKTARDARLKKARDARRTKESDGGTKITDAEQNQIDKIMAGYDKANPEPIRMASGGILKRQVFTAGEAGREAVIPLGSSEAMGIMRDALGGGGGGSTYNLVINAGLGTNPDELGRVIVESIKRFEKRNGQAFSAPILSTTQNIAGQTATGSAKTDFNRIATLRKG